LKRKGRRKCLVFVGSESKRLIQPMGKPDTSQWNSGMSEVGNGPPKSKRKREAKREEKERRRLSTSLG